MFKLNENNNVTVQDISMVVNGLGLLDAGFWSELWAGCCWRVSWESARSSTGRSFGWCSSVRRSLFVAWPVRPLFVVTSFSSKDFCFCFSGNVNVKCLTILQSLWFGLVRDPLFCFCFTVVFYVFLHLLLKIGLCSSCHGRSTHRSSLSVVNPSTHTSLRIVIPNFIHGIILVMYLLNILIPESVCDLSFLVLFHTEESHDHI